MVWKKSEGGTTIALKTQEVGSIWEGVYIGKKDVSSKLSKTGFQSLWEFMDNEGTPFAIWGCGSLDFHMKAIPVNSPIKIKYTGTYKTKFGQEGANVEVEWDDRKEDNEAKEPDIDF